jgi:hypothetical protein
LIASGVSVALGAPCFLGAGDPGAAVGEVSGVPVGDGVALGDADSAGSGVGEGFFFRLGDALGDGEAEGFFFLIDGVTDGVGDSCSVGRDNFFFGEAVGEGDGLFVVEELFFFRGFGVGVGVEKIFLIVSLNDCSAPRAGATVETTSASAVRIRINIAKGLTD